MRSCKLISGIFFRHKEFVVVYFILSRLLYLAYSANLGLPCMPHPGMGPLVLTSLPKDSGVSCSGLSSGRSQCLYVESRKNSNLPIATFVVVVVHFILSRLYPSFFSLFRLTMHAAFRHGTPSLTSLMKDGGVSHFGRSFGRSQSSFRPYTAMLNFS